MEKWEYMTEIAYAHIDSAGAREYIQQAWPNWKNPPKFTPEALIPRLNDLGKAGWELVSIEPVSTKDDGQVVVTSQAFYTTNAYFCAFKRRIEE